METQNEEIKQRHNDKQEDRIDQQQTSGSSLRPELIQLVRLCARYPEIGPPVAELAFKTGHADLGNEILKLALESEAPGLAYCAVAARQARQAGQHEAALRACAAGLRAFAAHPDRYPDADDNARLLNLLRLGFSVLLFDKKDLHADPEFVTTLAEQMPRLAARMDADPSFHCLLAQALWFGDRARSELEWERAAELGEPEHTYNARGTWYKEAERDPGKAEKAYRKGLSLVPGSALLMHNLAQLLLDGAIRRKDEAPAKARRLLNEADELVKGALRGDCPKGLRRHVHSTRAEIASLRSALRPSELERSDEERLRELAIGQVVRGRVSGLSPNGAFVALGGGLRGLLHRSELGHESLSVGQEVEVKIVEVQRSDEGRPRIGLSRRIQPAPPPKERCPEREEAPAGRRRERPLHPKDRPGAGRLASMGEVLLAKIKEHEDQLRSQEEVLKKQEAKLRKQEELLKDKEGW